VLDLADAIRRDRLLAGLYLSEPLATPSAPAESGLKGLNRRADARIRTAAPFITSDDGNTRKALQFVNYSARGWRGVHKLDLPCKDADSAATADVTAYGTDHAEKLRG